jgi:hypothetical protein
MMAALATLLLLGAQTVTCLAQAGSPGPYRELAAGAMNAATLHANEIIGAFGTVAPQWRGGVPPGSYQETCREIRMNGNQLQARCQKRDGEWRSTSLDARGCQREIINDNGYLRCAEFNAPGYGHPSFPGGHPGWGGGIPPGDYRRTCQNVRISGQRLEATCQTTNGGWHNTSLNNFERCGDKISNVDGSLRCGI